MTDRCSMIDDRCYRTVFRFHVKFGYVNPKIGPLDPFSDGTSYFTRRIVGTHLADCIGTMLKDFRAFQLAKSFYKGCKLLKLPSHLKDQLMRASSSIALNLAESTGKITQKDKIKYFSIAFGSLRESQAILEIEEIESPKLIEISDQLGGMLYKLCKVSERGKSTSDSEHHTEAPIIDHRSVIRNPN